MAKFATVAELLEDESRWTQGALARDADGVARWYDEPSATCWCVGGAIFHVYGDGYDETDPVINRLCEAMGVSDWSGMVAFNNSRTHAEVLAAVRKAGI